MSNIAQSTLLVNHHYGAGDTEALCAAVREILSTTPVTDIHTHLYAPAFGERLLYGVDELLTYHYLVAEYFRSSRATYESFWALDKTAQANAVWDTLFVGNTPLSEATRGVLTTLNALGLKPEPGGLAGYRDYFRDVSADEHVSAVFRVANVELAVMTNDPFDDVEREAWKSGYDGDPRFRAALRIDPLVNEWARTAPKLGAKGYDCSPQLNAKGRSEIRRFLAQYVKLMKPLYMAVSLPPEFRFPEESARADIIEECVLPVAEEFNIPFAMMIGVRRAVNPLLRLAGDGVGTADVRQVENLCVHFPRNKFMVTMLARENQHALCVAARKFPNLLPFGCWWFLNNPSLIEEMTLMRMEMLGSSFIPQHSDARVLEQVIYKWRHSREVLNSVLCRKYMGLVDAGWRVSNNEILRDVRRLLGGAFWEFLDSKP